MHAVMAYACMSFVFDIANWGKTNKCKIRLMFSAPKTKKMSRNLTTSGLFMVAEVGLEPTASGL